MHFIFSLLLSAFLYACPALAKNEMLRGDWQSAGAPDMPWRPKYGFQYHCQAELTDQERRISEGGEIAKGTSYELFAVNKFEVNPARTFSDLNGPWIWIAKIGNPRETSYRRLKAVPDDAFSVEGHGAEISFAAGSLPETDRVTLSGYVKLPLGEYHLTQHERETRDRSTQTLDVRVNASLQKEAGQPEKLPHSKIRSLYVVCDKVK